MLLGNGMMIHKCPVALLGDRWQWFVRDDIMLNATAGFGSTASIPDGYYPPYAATPSRKAGALRSRADAVSITLSQTGTGIKGMPGTGSASFSITFASAAGGLIVSGTGSAAVAISLANALLTASLNGVGSTTVTIGASASMGADAYVEGSTTLTISGSLTPYAVGFMEGSTVDTTTLTADAIAAAILAAAAMTPISANIERVNDVEVIGTGTSGDEWGPA